METVNAIVPAIISSSGKYIEVSIIVFHCLSCDKYYASDKHIKERERGGRILLIERLNVDGNSNKRYGWTGYDDWNKDSPLTRHGYNVGLSGTSRNVRQRILEYILSKNILKDYEVIEHLEWNIKQKENLPNMYAAVEDWKEDLAYVYKLIENGTPTYENFLLKYYSAYKG
jgi:hypothetical protein